MLGNVIMEFVTFAALAILAVVVVLLERHALRGSRGAWRFAALLPAMVVGWIALGILLNPPAHALWPVELIVWLIPAVMTLLVLSVMHGKSHGDATAR